MYNQHRVYRIFQLLNALRTNPFKTPKTLSELVGVSERSIYRYFELIKDLGFEIIKDEAGKFHIDSVEKATLPFNKDEIQFLTQILSATSKKNGLGRAILEKIMQYSEHEVAARELHNANLGKIIERLSLAIQEKRQVILLRYFSARSESITDRWVEPMQFTDNFEAISAFEIASKTNKYFNLERISDVVVMESPMEFESQHEYFKPDIFGFQGREMNQEVVFEMSLRASLLLKEEYPMSRPFITALPSGNRYLFKAKIQSFIGAARFVRGFADDVTVLGPEEFITFLAAD